MERALKLWHRLQKTRPLRALSHFTDSGGPVLAGGMSYQALFAVFAGLWLGFGVLGIFLRGREELLEVIVEQINTFVPGLLGSDGAVSLSMLLSNRGFDLMSLVAAVSLLGVTL